MKNVQITIDEDTLTRVDRIGKPLGLKRSEVVRQALRDWLRRHAVETFEQEWIAALQKKPDDAARAEDWQPSPSASKMSSDLLPPAAGDQLTAAPRDRLGAAVAGALLDLSGPDAVQVGGVRPGIGL